MNLTAERIDLAWIDPGYVSGHFAHSIASAASDMDYFGCLGAIHRFPTSLPALGRNVLVQAFLDGEGEWLWMVDSDMVFDKGHVLKLWETAQDEDVKIVSGLSFIFKDSTIPIPSYFLAGDGKFYRKGELHLVNVVPDAPMKVAATGLASTLVHRDVFEAMQAPRHEDYRWFDQIPLEGNDKLSGEDTQFFVRAAALGFDTYLDPNAETWHLKHVGIGKADFIRHWELREILDEEKEAA
jgi:hypothetical protein